MTVEEMLDDLARGWRVELHSFHTRFRETRWAVHLFDHDALDDGEPAHIFTSDTVRGAVSQALRG